MAEDVEQGVVVKVAAVRVPLVVQVVPEVQTWVSVSESASAGSRTARLPAVEAGVVVRVASVRRRSAVGPAVAVCVVLGQRCAGQDQREKGRRH